MKKFALSMLALALLLVGLDQAVGFGLERLFLTTRSSEVDPIKSAVDYQPQLVICGSSRALHHYVADSLGRSLGVRVYNLGRGAQLSSLYQNGVFDVMQTRWLPRTWIVDAEYHLYSVPANYDPLSYFRPYAPFYPDVERMITEGRLRERVKFASRIYPYNSMLLTLLTGLRTPAGYFDPRRGYIPLHGSMDTQTATDGASGEVEFVAPGSFTPAVDPVQMRYLRRLIDGLRGRGVQVIIVRSPIYAADATERRVLRQQHDHMVQTFGTLGVPFVDFAADPDTTWTNPIWYRDPRHLNNDGAVRFSRVLSDTLRLSYGVGSGVALSTP